jgi:signal transduction histidine kinase/ActR/RegA family two-component response regulator
MSRATGLIDWFAAPAIRAGDTDATRRARLIVICCAFGTVGCISYGLIHLLLFKFTLSSSVLFASAFFMSAAPVVLRLSGSYRLVAHILGSILLFDVLFTAWLEGGFPVGSLIWTLPLAILGPHLVGSTASLIWTVLCCGGYVLIYIADEKGWTAGSALLVHPDAARRLDLMIMIGVITVTLGLVTALESLLKQSVKEKSNVEDELRQAQKLESIGLLAGGVAHDFNNLLSVVLTYAHLLQDDIPKDDPRRVNVERIATAARRAAELTRQLLQFSRKDIEQLETFDLNQVGREVTDLLQRSLGERIELRFQPAADLWYINADPRHIQQVLLNLAINARDAMENGGVLTIETSNVDRAHPPKIRGIELPQGRYICLVVRDNGRGMSEEVKLRAFEPFYTTKPTGKGSGLGLSTVYGIIARLHGLIFLESKQGEGTTVTILLPATESSLSPTKIVADLAMLASKQPFVSFTLLLVEDDDAVRGAMRRLLTKLGFEVLTARGGEDALRICQNYAGDINVLLTDVVMPGISGSQLVEEAMRYRPRITVVYMSGYPDNETVRYGVSQGRFGFLQKPFSEETLLNTLATTLSEPPAERIDSSEPPSEAEAAPQREQWPRH